MLVIVAEFFGSLGLLAGLLTRVAALGIGAVMVGAVLLQHLSVAAEDGQELSGLGNRVNGRRLVVHAAMTGILNPKVAVFFLAFLPQFVAPERGAVLLQFLTLGLILATIGFLFDFSVAWIAGRARARLATSARFTAWRERITGTVLVALGLRLALPDRR